MVDAILVGFFFWILRYIFVLLHLADTLIQYDMQGNGYSLAQVHNSHGQYVSHGQ